MKKNPEHKIRTGMDKSSQCNKVLGQLCSYILQIMLAICVMPVPCTLKIWS